MGAWGFDLYDSDYTLDVVGNLCDFFKIDYDNLDLSELNEKGFPLQKQEKINFIDNFGRFLKREFKLQKIDLKKLSFELNKSEDKTDLALLWVIINDILSYNQLLVPNLLVENGIKSVEYLIENQAQTYRNPEARKKSLIKYQTRFENHLIAMALYQEKNKQVNKSVNFKI